MEGSSASVSPVLGQGDRPMKPSSSSAECYGGLKVTIVICALNEEENLPHVLPEIPAWVHEVLLVDGNSTDKTVQVARTLRPSIRILRQPGTGKGLAIRHGVESAEGDIIVTMDADGESDAEDLPKFIEPLLRGYDFAKGSRFATGWRDKPLHRILGNRVIAGTCNILYGTKFTDLCSGYNAFSIRVLEGANLWSQDDWNFEPLVIARVLKAGMKVIEIPQSYKGRLRGVSKLGSWTQGITAMKILATERFRDVGTHRRRGDLE